MALSIKAKCTPEDKHDFDVNTLIFHNGYLYSGADDGKIIKWDENIKKITECQAHPCSIYSIAALNSTIYSCSNDGTVKSWTLDLQEKTTLIQNAEIEFWKLGVSEGILFVGDDKGGITTIINDKPFAQYEILEGIKDMQLLGRTLYTGKDIDITITTIGDGPKPQFATRKVIQGRAPIALAQDKLIFVDQPASGFIIHENCGEFKQIATQPGAHSMIINAITAAREQTDDVVFYTGGWDKYIKTWKITSGKCDCIGSIDTGLVVNSLTICPKGFVYGGFADGFIMKLC